MAEPCLNRALWDVIAVWRGGPTTPMFKFWPAPALAYTSGAATSAADRSVTVLTFATKHETSFRLPRAFPSPSLAVAALLTLARLPPRSSLHEFSLSRESDRRIGSPNFSYSSANEFRGNSGSRESRRNGIKPDSRVRHPCILVESTANAFR